MRKSLEWSDVKTDGKGNSTIRYRCEALIWNKDRMILCNDFTFDKDGKYISHETIEKIPVKDGTAKPDIESLKKTADKYLKLLSDGQFAKAFKMGDEKLQKSLTAENQEELWAGITKQCGNFEKVSATRNRILDNNAVFDFDCGFEKATITIRIAVTPNKKIAGLFITAMVQADSSAKEGLKGNENGKPD
jgi:hypothetical protein